MTQDIAYFKTLQGFTRFIRERSVKSAFIKNFYQNNRVPSITNGIEDAHRRYLESKVSFSFIDYIIEWPRTNEGFKFWSNLSRKLEYLTALRCTTIQPLTTI